MPVGCATAFTSAARIRAKRPFGQAGDRLPARERGAGIVVGKLRAGFARDERA